MSEDALKLTTYFGERSRVRGRLLADELLDIHARHKIRSSILLRGIQGFGAKHRRRSDRLLTLSEDLPLVSMAVDTRQRIETVLGDVSAIGHEGLITLERVRLFGPELELESLPPAPDCAVKLTVYLGRHERINGSAAFVAVCRTLRDNGAAGATVLMGVDGTRHGRRERARFFARNASVPIMVMTVGELPQIAAAVGHVKELLNEPLFTVERVRLCKRDGVLLQPPHPQPTGDESSTGLQQKLTIVNSEASRYAGRPLYLELIRRLRGSNVAGATSVRGIWGFHGDHAPHGDRLLSLRRHVPVVTDVIDTPDRIAKIFDIVNELTSQQGLITSELVPATSALHASHEQLVRRLPPTPL